LLVLLEDHEGSFESSPVGMTAEAGKRILEKMSERLYADFANGPLMNCRPRQGAQRQVHVPQGLIWRTGWFAGVPIQLAVKATRPPSFGARDCA
jgi:hypothetical protein